MWLAYLRFDGPAETRVALVQCGSRTETNEVISAAKRVSGWELTEYAAFYAHAAIHARIVPNFPEELIYEAQDFLRRCGAGAAPPSTAPPGSSSGRGSPKALGSARGGSLSIKPRE
jgi:hypothetical protein